MDAEMVAYNRSTLQIGLRTTRIPNIRWTYTKRNLELAAESVF